MKLMTCQHALDLDSLPGQRFSIPVGPDGERSGDSRPSERSRPTIGRWICRRWRGSHGFKVVCQGHTRRGAKQFFGGKRSHCSESGPATLVSWCHSIDPKCPTIPTPLAATCFSSSTTMPSALPAAVATLPIVTTTFLSISRSEPCWPSAANDCLHPVPQLC
jgi:hypothetical protein